MEEIVAMPIPLMWQRFNNVKDGNAIQTSNGVCRKLKDKLK